MITLDTKVLDLSVNGYCRPAGDYICPIDFDGQVMGVTLDDDARKVDIMGAGSFAVDRRRELIQIIPDGMGATTNMATVDYQTEVAVLGGDMSLHWIPACSLSPRYHMIIVPKIISDHWCLEPSGFNIRRYRTRPDKYASGVQPTLARLVLRDRARHFTCLGGLISSRLAGEQ